MTSVEREPEPFDLGGFPSLDDLTPAQKQSIARRAGQRGLDTSPFTAGDGMFADWDSGKVIDRGDPNARGIDAMLDSDGTARQLEQVLTLPIRSADHALIGGSERGRKLVDEQFPEPQRALFIGQQTSAIPFRKAFFELDWRLDGRDVRLGGPPAFRPAIACESLFEKDTGRPDGFRKRVHDPGGVFNALDWSRWYGDPMPGWVPVPRQRSHVYVHGTHRQPLKGISDLSVCWWAYETRKKLLFLWLQYCERAVAPKVAVYGRSVGEAAQNALEMSKLRSGGYAPLVRPDDPAARAFEILEASTAAAGLFESASRFLEAHMVDSCLAGFTKLSSGASAGGRGSQALGEADQDYFQKARQAVANEQSLQATTDVLAPICILNGLDKSDVPQLRISLNADHMSESLDLAKTLLTATTVNAPDEFLDGLLQVVAPTVGLDADKLRDAIAAYRDQQAQQREQAAEQFDDGGLSERPGAPDPQAADLANEVDAAWAVVDASVRTGDPGAALDSLAGRPRAARTHIDLASSNDRTETTA